MNLETRIRKAAGKNAMSIDLVAPYVRALYFGMV